MHLQFRRIDSFQSAALQTQEFEASSFAVNIERIEGNEWLKKKVVQSRLTSVCPCWRKEFGTEKKEELIRFTGKI